MNFSKKTIAIVFVVTIALSLFVGMAAATPGTDPITQILQALLGLNTKVDNLGNTTQILASYHDSVTITGSTLTIAQFKVNASEPVLFTVTVRSADLNPDEVVTIARGLGGDSKGFFDILTVHNQVGTVTFAAKAMQVQGLSSDGIYFDYDVIVQGIQATIVSSASDQGPVK